MINKEKLQHYFNVMTLNPEQVKTASVVMMLGPTDSGKSTTINYLLGHEMHHVDLEGHFNSVVEVKSAQGDKGVAGIGHALATSKTLYAETFDTGKGYSLCDCPGFEDTRGMEERLVAAINNQFVIQSAERIKAILLTMDFRALSSSAAKSQYLRRLLPALESLLKNPVDHKESILFLFTKVDQENPKRLIAYLQSIRNELDKSIQLETAKNQIERLSLQLRAIDLMLSCTDRFVFVDPCDQGESRARIESLLRSAEGIPKQAFAFSEKPETRQALSAFCNDIAKPALQHFDLIANFPSVEKRYRERIRSHLSMKMGFELNISNIAYSDSLSSHLQQVDQSYREQIESKERELHDLKQRTHSQFVMLPSHLLKKGMPFSFYPHYIEVRKAAAEDVLAQIDQQKKALHQLCCERDEALGKIVERHNAQRDAQIQEIMKEIARIDHQLKQTEIEHHEAEKAFQSSDAFIQSNLSQLDLVVKILQSVSGLDTDGSLARFYLAFQQYHKQCSMTMGIFSPTTLSNAYVSSNVKSLLENKLSV